MAATWKILTAKRTTSTGGKSDVITSVSWSCMDTETVGGVDDFDLVTLATGKKSHDKRNVMKERDSKREMDRIKKSY